MNLVTSQGGPLIVMPHRVLPAWEGTDPPTGGRVIDVAWQFDPTGPATDYDRACALRQTGVIPVGDAEALVLRTGGDNAVWLPADAQGRGNVFLTQLAVDDEERFQASVLALVDRDFPPSRVEWTVRDPQLRLFDSGMAGTDIVTPFDDLELPVGTYEVRQLAVALPGVAEVYMHKLVLRS